MSGWLTNALGSRNADWRISREQTSERVVAAWYKDANVGNVGLPTQIVNDKGRYLQESDTAHSRGPFYDHETPEVAKRNHWIITIIQDETRGDVRKL